MKLIRLLAVVFVCSGSVAPALGNGLLPGLVGCDPIQTLLPTTGTGGLDRSSLSNPADIRSDSANITLEYFSENMIRRKTDDRLTADIAAWGKAESLFLPLRIANRPTTLALSHASTNSSAYYESDETGTQLNWRSDSFSWAFNHSLGATRIGVAGYRWSGQAPGTSLCPQELFSVFTGWTPVDLDTDTRNTLIQVARPISGSSEINFAVGSGRTDLHIIFGQSGNEISFPCGADTTQYDVGFTKRIGSKLSMSAGYSRSTGSGSNPIYRNVKTAGKLQYEPYYRHLSASLKYQKKPSSVWEVGFISSDWDLGLRGISLRGNQLGIDLKPFNDYIDFNANARLAVDFVHLGMQRQVSNKWKLGWRYKLAKARSDLDADYIGRAFFGLVSVTGTYDYSLFKTTIHGLELSAVYNHNAYSTAIVLEQLVPVSSDDESDVVTNPNTPRSKNRTVGGTTLSIICNRAF